MANATIRYLGESVIHHFHSIAWYYISCSGCEEGKCEKSLLGSLMTSLEMSGVSVTSIKFTPNWEDLLGVIVISEVVAYVTCSIIR